MLLSKMIPYTNRLNDIIVGYHPTMTGSIPYRPSTNVATPSVSVVLNTYNRASLVMRAIDSVLSQTYEDFELIVVDDGSEDETRAEVEAISDPRLSYIYQQNSGLSVGRNAGASRAKAEWIVFLDDDDQVEPQWLESFRTVLGDGVGLVFAGHKTVNVIDGSITTHAPKPLGNLFRNVTGSCLAGSWIMRSSLFNLTGGFLTELPTLVQSEFMLRAIPICLAEDLTIERVDSHHFLYSVAPGRERPTLTNDLTISAATMIMELHTEAFRSDCTSRSSWNAVIGVAAARSRQWRLAQVHFLRSALAQPAVPKTWARLIVSFCPGRGRIWRPQRALNAG